MSEIQHYEADLSELPSQYIVCLASCLTKKLDLKTEPLYYKFCKVFPYANLYTNPKYQKKQPGTYHVLGDGIKDRKIIIILSQIYPGRMNSPSDSKSRRLAWFKEALDDISTMQDLKSICFLNQVSKDCGGNWSEYYQAIADFSQTVNLKSNVEVSIGYTEKETESDAIPQISLINCFNPERVITLDQIFLADSKSKIISERDHLNLRGPKQKKKPVSFIIDDQEEQSPDQEEQSTKEQSPDQEEQSTKEQSANQEKEGLLNHEEQPPKRKMTFKKQPIAVKRQSTSSKPYEPKLDDLTSSSDEELETQNESRFRHPPLTDDEGEEGEKEETNDKSAVSQLIRSQFVNPFPKTKLNSDWTTPLITPNIHPSWHKVFDQKDLQDQLQTTQDLLAEELETYGNTKRFLPEFDSIFRAFQLCSWEDCRVVLLAQDPYANALHAMGLAFSVPEGNGIPKSLANMFKELKNEYSETYKTPNHGNLEKWASQGILLLNSSLTVREKERNSHQNYWRGVTDLIIESISDMKTRPVIFILWGNDAKKKKSLINTKRHIVLEANHPSPLSAYRGFFGCNHFKLVNQHLESRNLDPIDWQT